MTFTIHQPWAYSEGECQINHFMILFIVKKKLKLIFILFVMLIVLIVEKKIFISENHLPIYILDLDLVRHVIMMCISVFIFICMYLLVHYKGNIFDFTSYFH